MVKTLLAALAWVAGVSVVVFLVCLVWAENAKMFARRLAEDNERLMHKYGAYTLRGGVSPREDAYGTFMLTGEIETAKDYRSVRIGSAGPDREFGTPDDVEVVEVDLNKSRLVGKWLAKRSKEAAKGFVEGLRSKSEFSE